MDKDLRSMTRGEIAEVLAAMGQPAYRAGQIFSWMHEKAARNYDEMTNLPAALRARLAEELPLTCAEIRERQVSRDGTEKYLFAMPDGCLVESVLMRYKFGNSVCISSQVGCRMGCKFCASTLEGLERNLLPSEMLEQIYEIRRTTGEPVTHVVVMGTGEPMDNYENLVRFLRLLTDEKGMHLSRRAITVSTCGLPDGIRKLAGEGLPVNLALSLHAATDEKRRGIMPVANRYTIAELLEACKVYFEKTGRQITFEYALISGVNDAEEDVRQLAALAAPLHAHINLIPVNPVRERGYRHPQDRDVQAFKNKLEKSGVNVSIRRVMGRDIDGACGQLRHRRLHDEKQI